MRYATQTSVPGAPGNMAAYMPQPQQPVAYNTQQVIVAAPSVPVVASYGGGMSAIGNMAGMAAAQTPQQAAEYSKLNFQYVT